MLHAVDAELGRLVDRSRSGSRASTSLLVTADHGQCPLPDSMGGVRLDPIQLERRSSAVRRRPGTAVQYAAPSEVYLDVGVPRRRRHDRRRRRGAARHLPQNIGPYVPAARSSRTCSTEEFAAVFATTWLDGLADRDLYARFGPGIYPEADDRDPGAGPIDDGSSSRTETARSSTARRGEGAALAMRLVVKMAEVARAPPPAGRDAGPRRRLPLPRRGELDFVRRPVDGGGQRAVPTTLNVGALDLLHPALVRLPDRNGGAGARPDGGLRGAGLPADLHVRARISSPAGRAAASTSPGASRTRSSSRIRSLARGPHRYGDFIDLCLRHRGPGSGLPARTSTRAAAGRSVFRRCWVARRERRTTPAAFAAPAT